MSIAQTLLAKKELGEIQGFWEYKTIDGFTIGYTVRTMIDGKKAVKPYTVVDGKLKHGGFGSLKPIYNLQLLAMFPDKPIIIVEGEKTADAAAELFPSFNVLSWLGGCKSAKKADWSCLENKKVYLFPDNDEVGYQAMEDILFLIKSHAEKIFFVDIKSLTDVVGWDVANLDNDSGDIDPQEVIDIVNFSKEIKEELIFQYPIMSEGQKPYPLDVTENLKYLLDYNNIQVRWNMMKRVRDVSVPGIKFYEEENENASLTHITNLAVKKSFNIRRIDKHLDQISWENVYHPVRDWVKSKSLTNKGVLDAFIKTVKTTNDQLSYVLIKRWMLSAIYAVFSENNFCAQGVLVIQGEPGTHKSTFIMSLVPESMRAIKGGLSLDPSKKDDILTSSEYWIAELGELDATFRKADIARLKSHITNDIDDVRRPHAVRNSKMIRRTVYAATVNESKFLVDTTGNRRWWTVSVTEPIKTRHGLDMQQVWREVYELYLNGESPFLLENEMKMLNETNKDYEIMDPFEEKLDSYFDWESTPNQYKTATQVLSDIGYEKPSKGETTRMGTLLSKREMKKGIGRLRRSFMMPRLLPLNLR